jgi:hypothetical protein
MHARTFGRLGTALAGLALASMALSGTAHAAAKTIMVPDDFLPPPVSDTRATGHYEVVGTGLHVWTEGSTSTDKVAEYVATDTPLATVGEPSLDYTNTAGGVPGFQLIVDFDGDETPDGILVGEPGSYGNDWWLNNAADADVKANAPVTGGGSGSLWHGTLDQWRANFPDANVVAFGFSLGSGVKGDGVINKINFAGDTYTFAEPVVLTSKDQCKKGGWATSTSPVFKNQGDCVSSFASNK